MKIGIDFSINSTAMVIKNKNNEYSLHSFVPNYNPKRKAFQYHIFFQNHFQTHSYDKTATNSKTNAIQEQEIKLKNADNLSNVILKCLKNYVNPQDPITDILIEGYSFGSKGNSFIDLVTYNTFLKVKLIQNFGHVIRVISPKTLKKMYCGNGNATKCNMMSFFLQKHDENLHTFQDKIKELNLLPTDEPTDPKNDFVIPKPLDDIIDAIAIVDFELTF